MFKFVLLSCLLVTALAWPHHTAGHTGAHHDGEEKVEVAKPAVEDKLKPELPAAVPSKPADALAAAEDAVKPAEVDKEAAAAVVDPAKHEAADALKKHDSVVPLEAVKHKHVKS